jgi:hypothetical protein
MIPTDPHPCQAKFSPAANNIENYVTAAATSTYRNTTTHHAKKNIRAYTFPAQAPSRCAVLIA